MNYSNILSSITLTLLSKGVYMKVLIAIIATCMFSLNVMAAPATHGMVIFGKEKLHAYHLPMFHAPHNKQLVITFDVPADVKSRISDLQDTAFLTFVPAAFDLESFIKSPFNLKGDLYAGHFEQDGAVVLSDITLVNPKIEYVADLAKPNGSGVETYKVFGTKDDAYALHLLNGGSAFDKIFKLTATYMTNFDYVTEAFNLYNLEVNGSYTMKTAAGKCPSRNCGEPAVTYATFTADSLYFTDSVMGLQVHNHPKLEVKQFCKTRLCEPFSKKPVLQVKKFCKTRLCEPV